MFRDTFSVDVMWLQVYNDEWAHTWTNRTILQREQLFWLGPKERAFLRTEHDALCGHGWEDTACDQVEHC